MQQVFVNRRRGEGNRSAALSPLVSMRESPGFAGGRRRGYKSELKRRSLTAIYKAVVPSPPSGCAPINGIPRRRWRPFVRINSTKGSTLSRSYSLLVALTGKLIPRRSEAPYTLDAIVSLGVGRVQEAGSGDETRRDWVWISLEEKKFVFFFFFLGSIKGI